MFVGTSSEIMSEFLIFALQDKWEDVNFYALPSEDEYGGAYDIFAETTEYHDGLQEKIFQSAVNTFISGFKYGWRA